MTRHQWTHEQIAWLREKYTLMDRKRLLEAFNTAFECDVSSGQLHGAIKNHKIRQNVRTGRFETGSIPWNKGARGVLKKNKTSFEAGNIPHNIKYLWHEREDKEGYILMQVPERNPYTGYPARYKYKHVWIWEQANGPRPKGHVIIFRDGNNRNFNLDNLALLSRRELLVLNQRGYKSAPDELKSTIMALAKMEAKAGIRPKTKEGK